MPEKRNHRGHFESRANHMTLFRRFVRWITQAARFESLENEVLILQKAILAIAPREGKKPLAIEAPYDYGELGSFYQIKAGSELVIKHTPGG